MKIVYRGTIQNQKSSVACVSLKRTNRETSPMMATSDSFNDCTCWVLFISNYNNPCFVDLTGLTLSPSSSFSGSTALIGWVSSIVPVSAWSEISSIVISPTWEGSAGVVVGAGTVNRKTSYRSSFVFFSWQNITSCTVLLPLLKIMSSKTLSNSLPHFSYTKALLSSQFMR